MGGSGSGNFYHWWRGNKKGTVESCRSLDANRWMREGILTARVHQHGGWNWYNSTTGERTSSIGYEVCTLDLDAPWLRLHYNFTASGVSVDYRVRLATTRPRFGGLRWWFLCPLSCGGRPCGRRVGKLYLPPGGGYFGCRHCHDLTYESAQEHDKRVDALRRNPDALFAILDQLDDPDVPFNSNLLVALKAARKMR
jgi:hypothetical protein